MNWCRVGTPSAEFHSSIEVYADEQAVEGVLEIGHAGSLHIYLLENSSGKAPCC